MLTDNSERQQQIRGQREKEGYFPPDSLIRRVNREAAVLLGGGYAVLLQLAHPFVTAGVEDHSYFQSDTLARLYRTDQFIHTLVFADRDSVKQALKVFHAMHKQVTGRLGDRAGTFPEEGAYSGTDPQAKLWVFATFVDTGLRAYELFIKPLSEQERGVFYAESLTMGRLLGIPEDLLPPSLADFQAYMNAMLGGDTLMVTDSTRRLAHAVLYPDVGFWPAESARLLRLVTAGMLPERFREAYGLDWSKGHAFALKILAAKTRFFRRFAPRWIWESPLLGGKLAKALIFENRSWGA